jgi:galactokinase
LSQQVSARNTALLFEKQFGYEPEGVWSAPGRVNLIGEHTDYNLGFVLPLAIDKRTFAAFRLRDDQVAKISSSFTNEVIEQDLSGISKGSVSGWSAYPLGVAWSMIQEGASGTGFDLFIHSDVPVGAGLSSSAALESSVALALNELWGSDFSRHELAQIGQRAENEIVGAPTGIMDQTAAIFGVADHAVFIDCKTLEATPIPLNLSANKLELVVIDTKVAHRLSDGGYGSRRSACETAAKSLGVSALRELSVTDLENSKNALDDVVYRRAKHVVTENIRVEKTVALLKASGPLAIGELLNASHVSMRDDFEISVEELDLAVDVSISCGAIGARMTGGGFGGSAIAIIESSKVADLSTKIMTKFKARGFATPEIFSVVAADGARREI